MLVSLNKNKKSLKNFDKIQVYFWNNVIHDFILRKFCSQKAIF
jgi:hypothetical protein